MARCGNRGFALNSAETSSFPVTTEVQRFRVQGSGLEGFGFRVCVFTCEKRRIKLTESVVGPRRYPKP